MFLKTTYKYLFELDLKFVVVWKIKFKYLILSEMFLQVVDFFSSTSNVNIDVVNILIYIFWLMEFVFITKTIPNP